MKYFSSFASYNEENAAEKRRKDAMTRTSKLLSHGLFEKPFMDSRVQSRTLSKKA